MKPTLEWEEHGVVRTFQKEISGDTLFESNLALQLDHRFKSIQYIINDFIHVTSASITTEHTKVYAETDKMVSQTKHNLKIALVVPDGPLMDLAENYCLLMQEQMFECQIFESIHDARQWCSQNI